MKLTKLSGSTYYIRGGTNTGIYKFEDNNVLLIDPGLRGLRPKKLMSFLKENDLNIKYIFNTHEHDDHYGGCSELKDLDENIIIYSSKYAKFFIENPSAYGDYMLGGKGNELLNVKRKKENNNSVKIDEILNENSIVLNNEEFEIITLRGHSAGSIGILTKDKILFVGDLFVGNHILSKFSLLLLHDIGEYFNSIEKIKHIDFKYMILGHDKNPISKEQSYYVIENHKKSVNKYLNEIRDLLKNKITIDDILKEILVKNELSCNYKEYYFFRSTIVSMVSYLIELDEIEYQIKDGQILYYSKN